MFGSLNPFQSVFLPGYWTETVLAALVDDLQQKINGINEAF